MRLVAYSRGDVAGANIAGVLRERFGFKENEGVFDGSPVFARGDALLVESGESILHRSGFGDLKPDLLIVASRHKSESRTPTLTAHVTGNFGSADFGGESGRLSIAPAQLLSQANELLKLNVGALPYRVSLEVTHHGPTELLFPLVYVEVGGSREQWADDDACAVAAEVVSRLLFEPTAEKPAAIGFGGPHYAPNFSLVTGKIALGHIAPKYAVEHLNRAMIEQMISKTTPEPELAVFDWKGLRSGGRKRITGILDEIGLPWKKTSELK